MRKTITIAAAMLLIALGAAAGNVEKEDIRVAKKTIDVGKFTGITAGYCHEIQLTNGRPGKVEVSCHEDFLKCLDYKVVDGILHLDVVDVRAYERIHKQRGPIRVKVQMEEIRSLDLSGASKLYPTGSFIAEKNLRIKISGASEIEKELVLDKGENLRLQMSGASGAELSGVFKNAEVELSGASGLDLDLTADFLTIGASGASELEWEGKADKVQVECSGASELDLKGSAELVDIECSGASEVDAEELLAKVANAEASGASKIKVYGIEKLGLRASAMSSIKYYGPAKDMRISDKNISRGR